MKFLTLALALMFAAPVSAQTTHTVTFSNVDWSVSQEPGKVIVAGWAFDCTKEGQQPYAVKAYYMSPTNVTLEVPIQYRWDSLYRPDVAKAFPRCGQMNRYTGFGLQIKDLPPGHQHIYIEWASSSSATYTDFYAEVQ